MRTERTKSVASSPSGNPLKTLSASREEIAARAYEIYLQRGGVDGRDIEDWTQAERELMGQDATMVA